MALIATTTQDIPLLGGLPHLKKNARKKSAWAMIMKMMHLNLKSDFPAAEEISGVPTCDRKVPSREEEKRELLSGTISFVSGDSSFEKRTIRPNNPADGKEREKQQRW